jgi:hypothetical protein
MNDAHRKDDSLARRVTDLHVVETQMDNAITVKDKRSIEGSREAVARYHTTTCNQ